MSFISCFTNKREILSGDRGQALPPDPRQTYHIFTANLKNAKAGVYPKGKPLGFTPKGIFDKTIQCFDTERRFFCHTFCSYSMVIFSLSESGFTEFSDSQDFWT